MKILVPMPQNRMSKKSMKAQDKSSQAVKLAISSEKNQFARVEKVLGGTRFHVKFHDGEKLHTGLLATPRGLFSADGRKRVNIGLGDFVVLEGAELIKDVRAEGKDISLEIYGLLDSQTAVQLYQTGRIHKAIYEEQEEDQGGFIFSDKAEDSEEVDIDAI
jgi:translation initiation factor IF-1